MACSRGRRQAFSCGHKGYGSICHRCKQADELLAQAEKPEAGKNAQAMRDEAARLKTVPKRAGTMQAVVPA